MRERGREVRGAPWRGLGRRAASSAKQEVAGVLGRAPRLASVRPPGRGGRRQGGSGGGLGRWGSWAGWAGQVSAR